LNLYKRENILYGHTSRSDWSSYNNKENVDNIAKKIWFKGSVIELDQVHGSEIEILKTSCREKPSLIKKDGVITDKKNVLLTIKTADCVPIVLFDRKKEIICALHSGWRGTKEKIVEKGLLLFLQKFNSYPKDITAFLGPAIKSCCYEIKEDLQKEFSEYDFSIKPRGEKLFLDLKSIILKQLNSFEITDVENIDECNFCSKNLYFSYRRNKTEKRQHTFVGMTR
jgi:polyphenol oxidase